MGISLSKGQKINLSKSSTGSLQHVFMGLGWDPVKPSGFFARLFSSDDIDLDASCLMFDQKKELVEMVYYGRLRSIDGAIVHTGDNLTGEGDGDDEVIKVDLTTLPAKIQYLAFTINSFRGQTFDQVDNAFCRLVNDSNNQEICRYTLNEKGGHTGVIMAVVQRDGSGWTMQAIGEAGSGKTAKDMVPSVIKHL